MFACPSHRPRVRKPWRRIFLSLSRDLSVFYLFAMLLFYFLQNWLIFPGHFDQGRTIALITQPPAGTELLTIEAPNHNRITAVFGPALTPTGQPHPDPSSCPTIIFFYGNGSAINTSWSQFNHLRQLGANVLIPDYIGYGMSTGSPDESAIYTTADAVYDYLLSRPDLCDSDRIVAAGWSLGGAAAIDLASRRPVAGLVTFATFTSMSDIGATRLPFLPIDRFLHCRFDNQRKLAQVTCPILLCHGRLDSFVPPTMSQTLSTCARKSSSVSLLLLDSADHDTVFDSNPDTLYPALEKFLATINPPLLVAHTQ